MSTALLSGVSPSSPLGQLLGRAGELIEQERFAEAIAPMAEAVALQPDSAGLQANLGGLYVEAGQHREAVEPLRRALALNPRIAIAHWRLGMALQALGDSDGAIGAFQKAVEIRPQLADAHARMGFLYMSRGLRREAVESCRRAAEVTNDQAEKQFLEAQALIYDEREAEAEPILRSALTIEPDLPTAHGLLAQILVASGRFDEATSHYEAQLARTPHAGLCYYDLVRSRKITETDGHILKLIDIALVEQNLDDINRSVLLLAQGKALDDLGRFEEAMKSLDTASELRKRAFAPDIDKFERQVDEIIALFDAERIARLVSANADRRPVLIVGMPRSGTTLAEQVVSSHPSAAGAGELTFWRSRLQTVLKEGEAALNGDYLASCAAEYLEELRGVSQTALRICDKDPFNFLAVGLIHLALPRAAIIHCRRNQLDTALSIHQTHFSKSSGMPTGGEDLVRYFRAYRRLMEHWSQILPQGRIFEVEYERLTQWPQSEIPQLIDHIGLPWDENCLEPHVNKRIVRTPSGWQVRQSINTGSVDRWRNYEPWLGPLAALREDVPQSG
jgi:tetratricopeptide (TPR) repeat protein